MEQIDKENERDNWLTWVTCKTVVKMVCVCVCVCVMSMQVGIGFRR